MQCNLHLNNLISLKQYIFIPIRNQLNFPPFEQQLSSAEDGNPNARDIISSHEGIPQELDSFQSKQAGLRRQFPLILRNKPNYDQ